MCLEPDWKFWFSRLNSLKNTWYQKSFGFRLESPKKPEFRNFFHVEPISCSKWIAFDIFRRSKSQFFLSFFLYFFTFFSLNNRENEPLFSLPSDFLQRFGAMLKRRQPIGTKWRHQNGRTVNYPKYIFTKKEFMFCEKRVFYQLRLQIDF